MAAKKNTTGTAIKKSTPEKIFTVFNYAFFTLISIIMIIPFWHVLMMSLSDVNETMKGGIFLYVKGFNVDTYSQVFKNPMIWTGFATAIGVTFIGTAGGTLLTAMMAYALSKPRLRFGKVLMKSFFSTISDSFEESAKLDGANDVTIFFRIIIPLSKASIATIVLFNAVMYWNDYFSTVLYINSTDKWALQAVLRNMLTNTQQAMQQAGVNVRASSNVTAETIKAGSVVVATVPILIIYPFLQKYFVKGVMIGGVKG